MGWLKDGKYEEYYRDVLNVANICHKYNKILKVIIESSALNDETLITDASILSAAAHADFVKTSTGFHAAGGAKVEHVKIMRQAVGPNVGVKAAGGVRSAEDAAAVVAAGATRIGTSGGVAIVSGMKTSSGY